MSINFGREIDLSPQTHYSSIKKDTDKLVSAKLKTINGKEVVVIKDVNINNINNKTTAKKTDESSKLGILRNGELILYQ